MRFSKQKGGFGALQAHHERTKEKYASNPDIDTNRSKYNIHIIKPETSYRKESDNRIEQAGCRTRKDSVRFIDTLITASPDFFKNKKREEIKAYFQTAVDFLSKKIGRHNIFTAVVHLDERTPHMHLCFTPITEDGRLSAKEIIGNRTQLTQWQDSFFEHMVKKFPNIERGESASETGRKHIPTRLFKQAVKLSRQLKIIMKKIDEINPLNTKSKTAEVVALFEKFFPNLENHETQMKKYKREFDRLKEENTELTKKAKAGDQTSIERQLAFGKLQSENAEMHRLIDSIPEELLQQARQNQKTKTTER